MKKILIIILLAMPMFASAQDWVPMMKKVFSCAPAWSKWGGFSHDEAQYEMSTFCGAGGYSGQYGYFRIGKDEDLSIQIYYNSSISYLPGTMFYVGESMTCWNPSGRGRAYSLNGELLYEGEFNEDGKPLGMYPNKKYGKSFKAIWEGGNMYLGEVSNGVKNGWGIYIWSNGDCLFGEWRNGQKCGYGMKKFNNTCSIVTSNNWVGENWTPPIME